MRNLLNPPEFLGLVLSFIYYMKIESLISVKLVLFITALRGRVILVPLHRIMVDP